MANKVRGEVELKLGDHKVILCAEMERLARLSDAIGNPPLQDVFRRLAGSEPRALLEAVRAFTIDGDAGQLIASATSFDDLAIIREKTLAVLQIFVGDPKNGEGGTAAS